MIYCIILIVWLSLSLIKTMYNFRTIESSMNKFNQMINDYKKYISKPWVHYLMLAIMSCVDLSVIGYLIFAACNL